jgi:hypothetical protein
VCEAPIKPPTHWRQDFPADLGALILRAIERDRSKRYPTAEQLGQDAARWLADEPVHAWLQRGAEGRRPTLLSRVRYRWRQLSRRDPTVSRMALLAASAILIASISFALLLRVHRRSVALEQHTRTFHQAVQQSSRLKLAGQFDESLNVIEQELARWPSMSENYDTLSSLRDEIRAYKLRQVMAVAGTTAVSRAPVVPEAAATQRGDGEPWRSRDERLAVKLQLEQSGFRLLPHPPAHVDPAPTYERIALMIDLDQYEWAEQLLQTVPQASQESWDFRYLNSVLLARKAVNEDKSSARLDTAQASLRQLLEQAQGDSTLAAKVPLALYNLSQIARYRGEHESAAALLKQAAAHPAALEVLGPDVVRAAQGGR